MNTLFRDLTAKPEWAEQTGPHTAGAIAHILERRIHLHQPRLMEELGLTHGGDRFEKLMVVMPRQIC
ncbi:hypothetical protein D3C85_1634150 [compost metagenome]|uniref:hypothetical protein n=1 Tax=Pseudomonas sp. Irchel s3h17 TaxID=2009182 RepID=UPI000FB1AD5E